MNISRGIALDELDKMLINELEVNVRQPYSALAAKLGISSMTVSRRIQRLQSERVIQPVTMVNTGALGFHVGGDIWIKVNPGKVEAVAYDLASHSNLSHITIVASRYDIHVWAMFRKYDDLLDYLTNELAGIPGIVNIEKTLFVKSLKRDWTLLGTDKPHIRLPRSTYKCDELDLTIIREMQLNPKQDVVELAAKLQIGAKTAGRRLENLIRERFIKVICVADPLFLGFNTEATILVNAQFDKIRAVANELTRVPQIKHVTIFNGDYDIAVTGNFRDLSGLQVFLEHELGKVHGIVRYETTITLKVIKRSFGLPAIGNMDKPTA